MPKFNSGRLSDFKSLASILISFIILSPSSGKAQGQLVFDTFHSGSLEDNFLADSPDKPFAVYLPPDYENNAPRRFPVIYLLHGFTHTHRTWLPSGELNMDIKEIIEGLIAKKLIQPMIVVMPNGYNSYHGSWYTNSSVTGNWEDYIVLDLITHIDATYRTLARQESRGIAGHSMGGTGAFKLAMKHPDKFCAVFSLSGGFISFEHSIMGNDHKPYLIEAVNEDGSTSFTELDWRVRVEIAAAAAFAPNKNRLPYYGDFPVDQDGALIDSIWAIWQLHDAYAMIPTYKNNLMQLNGIWIDCGTNDDAYAANQKISEMLDSEGIDHTWSKYKGGHMDQIGQRIEQHMLPFFSDLLKADTVTSFTEAHTVTLSANYTLYQNYPNPFNPRTTIEFKIPGSQFVTLKIYNLLGKEVTTLVSDKLKAGTYHYTWDATGFSSGLYLYSLETADGFRQTRKLIVLK